MSDLCSHLETEYFFHPLVACSREQKERGAVMTRKIILILVALTMVSTMAWADTKNIPGVFNNLPLNQNSTAMPSGNTGAIDIMGILNSLGVNLNNGGIGNVMQGNGNVSTIPGSLQNTINLSTILNSVPGGSGILNSSGGGNDGQALVNGIITSVMNQGGVNIPAEIQTMLNNPGMDQGLNLFRALKLPGSK
jgi:hypothetical protein